MLKLATGAVTYLVDQGDLQKHTIQALSGTSSGALVATLCWGHMLEQDIDGIPSALKAQWTDLAYGTIPDAPTAAMLELGSSVAELNPFYQCWRRNAVVPFLRQIYKDWILRHIDIDKLRTQFRSPRKPKKVPMLRLGATDILHARPKILHEEDLCLDVLCATGSLDDAIGITDIQVGPAHEEYIDGARSTNPPLTTLIDCQVDDIWLIEAFPHRWQSAPRTPMESKSRKDELWQCALIW